MPFPSPENDDEPAERRRRRDRRAYDSSVIRRAAAAIAVALALTACAGGGSQTQCGTDGCTVTFPRTGDATVSVLGIDARLLGVQGGNAELDVEGQRIVVPVGGETTAGGFTVGVTEVTDTAVTVRIRP